MNTIIYISVSIYVVLFLITFVYSLYQYRLEKKRPMTLFWDENDVKRIMPIWKRFIISIVIAPIYPFVLLFTYAKDRKKKEVLSRLYMDDKPKEEDLTSRYDDIPF